VTAEDLWATKLLEEDTLLTGEILFTVFGEILLSFVFTLNCELSDDVLVSENVGENLLFRGEVIILLPLSGVCVDLGEANLTLTLNVGDFLPCVIVGFGLFTETSEFDSLRGDNKSDFNSCDGGGCDGKAGGDNGDMSLLDESF
jgi:hypothetical protein